MKTSNSTKKEIVVKGEYDTTPFITVSESDILTQDDIKTLIPLKAELQEAFVKSQAFRTRTEMEVSVLNDIKFPTPSSKYWQAMREQNVMFTQLVLLSFDYRKNQVNIEILKRDIEKEADLLKKKLLQINIDKKLFIGKSQEKTAKARIRELIAWSQIKEREAKLMKETELLEVDNHQLVSYTKRWIKQSMEMGSGGSPPERQNLLGQLRSGILGCIDKGIIDDVLNGFSIDVKDKIREEYGIKDSK